jgi:hypothetical protein
LRRAQLNGVSKGGEHPLCNIEIGGGVKSPPAKWFRFNETLLHGHDFFQFAAITIGCNQVYSQNLAKPSLAGKLG